MMQPVQSKLYNEFIPNNEIQQFEKDIESKKYKHWVDKYSKHLVGIFGAFMFFSGYDVDVNDVTYFKSKGVNLNLPSNAYPSNSGNTTPLCSACEYRNMALIKALVSNGANIIQEDPNGFTPLEFVMIGHCQEDTYDAIECENFVTTLVELGATKTIRKDIIENSCQEYKKKSAYLSKFFTEVFLREPAPK